MAKRRDQSGQSATEAFHFPDTKRQREMLNDALVNIQTQGYQAFMQLIIAEAQTGEYVTVPLGDGRGKRVPKAEHLRDLRESVRNSKLAAARIKREIGSLPDDPIEPDDEAEGPQAVKD